MMKWKNNDLLMTTTFVDRHTGFRLIEQTNVTERKSNDICYTVNNVTVFNTVNIN